MITVLCDEHVPHSIVMALRLRGETILHCDELGRKGLLDSEHLAFSAEHGYTFFTYDIGDFKTLHTQYIQEGKSHAGLVFAPQLPVSEAIRRLSQFLQAHEREELADNVWHI